MKKMLSGILLAGVLASLAFIYSPGLASMQGVGEKSITAPLTGALKAFDSITTFTISGNIKSDDANLSDVIVSLTGGQTVSVSTGADGNYSFTVPANADYTVTVSKNGIVFNPASQTFANLQADKLADFQNGATLCIPSPSGLIAWYKGEYNVSDSAGSNNATLLNGATYALAKVGQGFSFDGQNDYAEINNSSFNPAQFSISTWVYIDPDDALNQNSLNAIVAKNPGTNNAGGFLLAHDDRRLSDFPNETTNTLKFQVSRASNGGETSEVILTNAFPAAGWYYIVATFDGTNARLYLNGAPVGTGSAIVAPTFNNLPLRIGAAHFLETNGVDDRFKGIVDETQIYNRALYASEVAAIHAAGSAGVCSNAVFTNLNPNGKIAFSSTRTGNFEIFVMNPDGSNQTNLTNNSAANDADSAFSPDGSKIAFTSLRNRNNIYVMNADGSNQIRLTTDDTDDYMPSWSPDGTKIVYSSQRTGYGDIYVMNSDGTNQIRLTTHIAADYSPKFSPDGSRIVFYSNRDGNYEIYVMNADGSNQTRLTNNSVVDGFPAFSPDGSKIAFVTDRDGNFEIFVMNADGSNPVNLTNNSAGDYYPAWSSDGSKIAFETNRHGYSDIYVMNADGINPTRLTNNTAIDSRPTRQTVGNGVMIAPASSFNITFNNITQAGYTAAAPLSAPQLPALPARYSLTSPVAAHDVRTSAAYSGNITVTFQVPNIPHSQICNRLRSLHFENNWTDDNNAAPIYNAATKICTVSQTVSSLSPFVVAQMTAPTAASVSVGGRVLTAEGRGIRNARVTLTNSAGETRTVLTGAFGNYRFTDVPVGGSYVISAAAKRFTFALPVQTLTLQEEQNDVNFTAYN
jgi:Tol biopolymer transport system component